MKANLPSYTDRNRQACFKTYLQNCHVSNKPACLSSNLLTQKKPYVINNGNKICNFANFYAGEQLSNTLQVLEQSAQENMWTMRVICYEMCICLDSKL